MDTERSLCTDLKTANNYKVDQVYSAGFFVSVSLVSIEILALHSDEQGKTEGSLHHAGSSDQGDPDEDDTQCGCALRQRDRDNDVR